MKRSLQFLTVFSLIISCAESVNSNNNTLLKERFHGKYEVLSAISEVAVDLNMDGITSNNLFNENDEVNNAKIEIRLENENKLFIERWPIEWLGVGSGEIDSSKYDSSISYSYAHYSITSEFEFANSDQQISLIDTELIYDNYGRVDRRFAFPESIIIDNDDIIIVITNRYLYTSSGYLQSRITARYKRFTSET